MNRTITIMFRVMALTPWMTEVRKGYKQLLPLRNELGGRIAFSFHKISAHLKNCLTTYMS